MRDTGTASQLIRYGIVGIASNLLLYTIYLLLTAVGVSAIVAMTSLYLFGVLQTFVFNRNWTFRASGAVSSALMRYILVYALGYAVNYFLLSILVDQFEIPHQFVMAGLFVMMAVYFFVAQKFWVFRH